MRHRLRRAGNAELPAVDILHRQHGAGNATELQVCVAYDTPAGRTTELPVDDLASARPVYRTFKGWTEDLAKARSITDGKARHPASGAARRWCRAH